jgi:hypothetical protein
MQISRIAIEKLRLLIEGKTNNLQFRSAKSFQSEQLAKTRTEILFPNDFDSVPLDRKIIFSWETSECENFLQIVYQIVQRK